MRHAIATIAAVLAVLLVVPLIGSAAAAQDDLLADHPAVGTWLLDDGGVAVIHADGTYSASDLDGGVVFGAWAPIGPREVAITYPAPMEAAIRGGRVIVRATARLAGGGMRTDVIATIETLLPDGGSTGELGPIETSGTRLLAEAPGEPVGPYPPLPETE